MNHLRTISRWALPSAKFTYNILAVSAEAFCRHSFGRRYAPSLLVSFCCCFVALNLGRANGPQLVPALTDIYLLIFFILVLYHIARMWRQRATIHSHSTGQSWEFWQRFDIQPIIVKTLLEPIIHVLAGLLIYPLNNVLSVWLLFAGLCLFIKEFIANRHYSNRVRDAVDARIEGERIGTGVRQQTAPQGNREQRVAPVVAAGPALPPGDSIQQIYSRLDPALQRLVAPPNENRPNSRVPNRPTTPLVVIRNQTRPVGARPRITPNRNHTSTPTTDKNKR